MIEASLDPYKSLYQMRRSRTRRITFACLCICWVWAGTWEGTAVIAWAAETRQVNSEKALNELDGNSWFDSNSDAFVPPTVRPLADDPIRRDGWLAKPKTAKSNNWNWDWFPKWSFRGADLSWLRWLILFVLATLLIVGLGTLAYFMLRDYYPASSDRKSKKKRRLEIDQRRVEDLPFEVQPTDTDPLSQAELLMRAGRYDEAIIYLFGYMLLALDHAHRIQLQKGKTNRMYLRELKSEQLLSEILKHTMLTFEDVFFGRYSIGKERFLACWSRVDEFHRAVLQSEVGNVSEGQVTIR